MYKCLKERGADMGFTDSDFESAAKECSNTQLYKQAGNSIVVNVLEELFKNLFNTDIKNIERRIN